MPKNKTIESFIKTLLALPLIDLESLATKQGLSLAPTVDKHALIVNLIQETAKQSNLNYTHGVLELNGSDTGKIRTRNCFPSQYDCLISRDLIDHYKLVTGDSVQFTYEVDDQRNHHVTDVYLINKDMANPNKNRLSFSDLTPIYPDKSLRLETESSNTIGRLLDIFTPIGYGQRALIVSPPKAGKTTIMKSIANSIATNHPDSIIKVLLIDERPEEVTDMKRSIKGEVIYSTFDEFPQRHVSIAELVFENAKRLVESGKNVVLLLDSITRLARAYNLVVAPSGRTLSGGLDPNSLHKPKRFFGGARQIEFGGSLTIIATALVNTGSRMDDIIYEEFKGTGNMELHLDRNLANRDIFPAIDTNLSSTRKSEFLLTPEVRKKVRILRKNMRSDSIEELITLLKQSESNHVFFDSPFFNYTA